MVGSMGVNVCERIIGKGDTSYVFVCNCIHITCSSFPLIPILY